MWFEIGKSPKSACCNNAGDFPITRRADPKSLSDEELAQICAHSRSEDNLLLGGCLGSIALVLLLVVDVLFVGPAMWPYFLGLILVLAAVFWAHDLVRGSPAEHPQHPTAIFCFKFAGIAHHSIWRA
ncbi:MAG: hypothetical protein WBP94_00965 [Rhodomicrobiaceae bacterium]